MIGDCTKLPRIVLFDQAQFERLFGHALIRSSAAQGAIGAALISMTCPASMIARPRMREF